MRRLLAAVILAALGLAHALAAGAAEDPARTRIPTVTRLVKLFAEREGALATALQNGNAAAVEKMLDGDFELRAGWIPGSPTPRDQWIALSTGKPASAYQIEQMAVHEYGEIAVVSFLQAAMSGNLRNRDGDIFTVDVWKRAADTWTLAVRYASPAGSSAFAIPGASTEPPLRKRY
jgi:hypothetical protein